MFYWFKVRRFLISFILGLFGFRFFYGLVFFYRIKVLGFEVIKDVRRLREV